MKCINVVVFLMDLVEVECFCEIEVFVCVEDCGEFIKVIELVILSFGFIEF